MSLRYFTLEEANSLLPELEPVVEELMNRQARVMRQRQALAPVLDDYASNIGGRVLSDMTQEFVVIEQLMGQIESYGCVLKDPGSGLLDFLAQHNGRDVYLCWRFGEAKITHYHELHTGFSGRRRIA